MARLIDAESPQNRIYVSDLVIEEMKKIPTVDIDRLASSQLERMAVVHCKDCKHRDPEDERCDCGCWHTPFTTNDNDFCSYGERRENR